jgi:chitinase
MGTVSTAGSGGSSTSVAGAAGSSMTMGGSAGGPSGGTSSGGKGGGGTGGASTVQPDTKAPTTPSGLQTSAITATSVTLSWTASTDNVGVTGYRLFNGGTQITTVTGTNHMFKGLAASTAYTFGVEAYDAADNTSATASKGATTTATTMPVCDASSAVAKLVHGSSYTANASACIQLSVNPAWNPVDVLLEQTAGGAISYSYKACNGNGTGTISSVVHFFTGTNPGCDFFVQLTGSGTVAYYD